MGVRRLRKKDSLNYRKGSTSRYCSICDHFIFNSEFGETRCSVMGNKPGRLYKINSAYVCDSFTNENKIKKYTENLFKK